MSVVESLFIGAWRLITFEFQKMVIQPLASCNGNELANLEKEK